MPKINAFNGNDATFVPGKIYGLRSFELSQYGTLAPITAKGAWGVTATAYCARQKHKGDKAPQHKCTCGLYGYFNSDNDAFYSPVYVSAVFEAHGNVIVGDRGFRAEKARLLGFSLPDTEQVNQYVKRTIVQMILLILGFALAYYIAVNYLLADRLPQLILFGSLALMVISKLFTVVRVVTSWKNARWKDKIALRELKKNYPGVKQFASREELLTTYSNHLSQSQELADNVTEQKTGFSSALDFLRGGPGSLSPMRLRDREK